jgi:hypothetical protein
MTVRRFPPPWSVEEQSGCFAAATVVVCDAARARQGPRQDRQVSAGIIPIGPVFLQRS